MENRRGGCRFQLENNICLSQTHAKLAWPSKTTFFFFKNFVSGGFRREKFETFLVLLCIVLQQLCFNSTSVMVFFFSKRLRLNGSEIHRKLFTNIIIREIFLFIFFCRKLVIEMWLKPKARYLVWEAGYTASILSQNGWSLLTGLCVKYFFAKDFTKNRCRLTNMGFQWKSWKISASPKHGPCVCHRLHSEQRKNVSVVVEITSAHHAYQ